VFPLAYMGANVFLPILTSKSYEAEAHKPEVWSPHISAEKLIKVRITK